MSIDPVNGHAHILDSTTNGTSILSNFIPEPIRNYFTFSGRITRSRFWRWVLFLAIVYAIAITIDRAVVAPMLGYMPFEEGAIDYVTLGCAALLFSPWLNSAVRRLHDIDRTGWWMLLAAPVAILPLFTDQMGFFAYQNITNPELQQWVFILLPVAPLVFMLPILIWHLKRGSKEPNQYGARD